MEQVKRPGKWLYAVVWGSLWAPLTVLGIILFDWYTTHHLDSLRHIVFRLVTFMTGGIIYGLGLHRYQESRPPKPPPTLFPK
jgi:hypothetical protein